MYYPPGPMYFPKSPDKFASRWARSAFFFLLLFLGSTYKFVCLWINILCPYKLLHFISGIFVVSSTSFCWLGIYAHRCCFFIPHDCSCTYLVQVTLQDPPGGMGSISTKARGEIMDVVIFIMGCFGVVVNKVRVCWFAVLLVCCIVGMLVCWMVCF